MKGSKIVVGVFTYLDDTLRAVEAVKETGADYRVYSPTVRHEIEEATMPDKSPVRKITLTGGLTGVSFGFWLAIMCSLDWPMRVSAKIIPSVPAFFVIGYECMILFAALATFGAIFYFCRLPHIFSKPGYDPRFSDDKFGVAVGCGDGEVNNIKDRLLGSGADEVEVREGL